MLACADMKDVPKHDDFEYLADLVAAPENGDGSTETSQPDEEADESADAGAGDNRHIRKIEKEESRVVSRGCAGGNVVPEHHRAIHLEVAGEADEEAAGEIRNRLVAELHVFSSLPLDPGESVADATTFEA